ncbi:GFA family protein [Bradyrhizobium erythrophlei]|uniref:GFA family protein n=1 Tax=Bradyrhizobium erythrophlei TaxID=1437360 RepID=UPI0035EEA88A
MGFSGGCACGAVRYTISAEPIRGFQCQCRDCQRDTGGGHSSVFVFARDALTVTGEVREIARTSDGGTIKRKGFCPSCGSPIYNKPDKSPEFVGIYVGGLDDASAFKPAVALFCSRGYAWDHLDPDLRRLPEWYPAPR